MEDDAFDLRSNYFAPAGLTLRETVAATGLSVARVLQIEEAALRKLARHPAIRALAEDYGILEGEGC